MKHGVFALDVEAHGANLRSQLRGTARKFLPHITILPRFAINSADEWDTDRWRSLASHLTRTIPDRIELRGVRYMGRGLAWYECKRGCRGFHALREMHELSLKFLAAAADAAPASGYIQREYRPHLTIFWHSFAENSSCLPSEIQVTASSFALYLYARSPVADAVRRTEILPRQKIHRRG